MDLPGNDYDSDDLASLDFSGGGADDAESEHSGTELDALHGLTEREEEPDLALFTVINPQGSVSVTALLDGRVQQITLTDKASGMTESGLAEEIFVIADLARQKARAAQYTMMVENMGEMTGEGAEQSAMLREFVGMTLNLPTPEEAAAAEAEVFATRYDVDYSHQAER